MKHAWLTIAVLLAGCTTTVTPTERDQPKPKATSMPTVVETETPASRVLIKRVQLERSGGFAGSILKIDITPAGAYQTALQQGSSISRNQGELEQPTLKTLEKAFEGFDKYKAEYLARDGTADDFKYVIKYGDKAVTFSDASPDVPAKLVELCRLLIEQLKADR